MKGQYPTLLSSVKATKGDVRAAASLEQRIPRYDGPDGHGRVSAGPWDGLPCGQGAVVVYSLGWNFVVPDASLESLSGGFFVRLRAAKCQRSGRCPCCGSRDQSATGVGDVEEGVNCEIRLGSVFCFLGRVWDMTPTETTKGQPLWTWRESRERRKVAGPDPSNIGDWVHRERITLWWCPSKSCAALALWGTVESGES
jgi:hypothetical protein